MEKRKLPTPEKSQELLEKSYKIISKLMNSSYTMNSYINRDLEDFLDEYYEVEKIEYDKGE